MPQRSNKSVICDHGFIFKSANLRRKLPEPMNARAKNIIYSVILIVSILVVYQYRKSQSKSDNEFKPAEPVMIDGMTMGTTYHITYFDEQSRNFKTSVDSLLEVFNKSLNTYLPNSEITTFNKNKSSFRFDLPFFLPVAKRSMEIAEITNGAFDPTVMPLVNVWGFGPARRTEVDSLQVDSILQFVGYENIHLNNDSIWKYEPRVQLDFSAIAKGYGVDVVADFLKSRDIENMFVEIGGEVVALGENKKSGRQWVVGILDPVSTIDDQKFLATINMKDRAIATSGNYFNYREVNGKRYSHTIDPHSGYPIQREILSASIIANDCMTADAWATACMVMGHDKAIELLGKQSKVDAFLIFSTDDGSVETFSTPGIVKIVSFE